MKRKIGVFSTHIIVFITAGRNVGGLLALS